MMCRITSENSLGQCGDRTNGLMIGNFFAPFSLTPLASSFGSSFAFRPLNRLDFEPSSGSFGLNKLPQLIRRVAAGEQLKNRIRSGSMPSSFGLTPEWRRSFSLSYSFTVRLGEWLEWRRFSLPRCTRNVLPDSGDGGST